MNANWPFPSFEAYFMSELGVESASVALEEMGGKKVVLEMFFQSLGTV